MSHIRYFVRSWSDTSEYKLAILLLVQKRLLDYYLVKNFLLSTLSTVKRKQELKITKSTQEKQISNLITVSLFLMISSLVVTCILYIHHTFKI